MNTPSSNRPTQPAVVPIKVHRGGQVLHGKGVQVLPRKMNDEAVPVAQCAGVFETTCQKYQSNNAAERNEGREQVDWSPLCIILRHLSSSPFTPITLTSSYLMYLYIALRGYGSIPTLNPTRHLRVKTIKINTLALLPALYRHTSDRALFLSRSV